jgi:branched-chain amino acid transport system substrate-binding protein
MKALRALVAGLIFAIVWISAPVVSRAADPYEVSVIASLTGPGAFLGKEEQQSLFVLRDLVNKEGGIRGRQIQFVVQDDQTNPQIAVQLLNGTLAKHVPFLIGGTLSSSCNAMSALVNGEAVLYCFTPSVHPPLGSYVFSASTDSTQAIIGTIRYFRERGWRKIAVLSSSDATGQDADRSFNTALSLPENKSVSIVDAEHFNVTDISIAAQMAHIRESGAEAAIFWTTGTPFGTTLREAMQAGLNIPIATSGGNLIAEQLEQYAAYMPKAPLYIMAPPWPAGDQLPKGPVRTAVLSYLEAFSTIGVHPDAGQSIPWDMAQLLLGALRKYGFEVTANQVRTYIAETRGFAGINGIYDFGKFPQRGIGLDSMLMVQWVPVQNAFRVVSNFGGQPLR